MKVPSGSGIPPHIRTNHLFPPTQHRWFKQWRKRLHTRKAYAEWPTQLQSQAMHSHCLGSQESGYAGGKTPMSGRDIGGHTLLGYSSQSTSSLHVYFQCVSHAGRGKASGTGVNVGKLTWLWVQVWSSRQEHQKLRSYSGLYFSYCLPSHFQN